VAALAGIGLAVAGCGGGGTPAVNAPPASAHTATEQAAVRNWLAKTNQMWLLDGFAAVDQVSVGQMRTLYLSEERQASRPRAGGQWKLAAAVNHSDGSSGWPALCTRGTPPAASAVLAPGDYTTDLARVLTRADNGAAQTTQTASPFAVNDFLAGPGSIPVQSATQIRQDRKGGVTFTGSFTPAPDTTFALPLANGHGYWVIGSLTQHGTYSAPSGLRAKAWPDGNQVAAPRPVIVHHESDTFTTTYTAIDPLRPHHAAVTLDGFFGWPLTATAS
jgi:hypothetical protein